MYELLWYQMHGSFSTPTHSPALLSYSSVLMLTKLKSSAPQHYPHFRHNPKSRVPVFLTNRVSTERSHNLLLWLNNFLEKITELMKTVYWLLLVSYKAHNRNRHMEEMNRARYWGGGGCMKLPCLSGTPSSQDTDVFTGPEALQPPHLGLLWRLHCFIT